MPGLSAPRTSLQRYGSDRARRIRAQLASEIRTAREDAGMSVRRLAKAAGVSHSTLHALEREEYDPSTAVLARVGEALGLDLSVRFFQSTRPPIRDHLQSLVLSALIASLHARWRPAPEVPLIGTIRGVIDLVLDERDEHGSTTQLVACEAHSQLRRLEQQIRRASEKAAALAGSRGIPASRLLLLRSTEATRELASTYGPLLGAAYPARAVDLHAALTSGATWPGDGLLWCRVEAGQATLLDRPPRGVRVGR